MAFKCPKCPAEFTTQRDLDRHLAKKNPCDKGPYRCDGCLMPFTSKRTLNEHVKKGRCKGKSMTQVNQDLSQEIEQLRTQAETHEQQLQMTNSVTAAAAAASSSGAVNVTQHVHNHITINVHQHTHVSALGEEKLSHFSKVSDEEMLSRLKLTKGPAVLSNWCALLRADEEHPENHNALLLAADSPEMACCRKGKWAFEATDKILLEISRTDMMRLYTHLGRYDQNATAQAFRHEYLLHDLMASSNADSIVNLKPFMEAVAQPIIDLTQKFYATTVMDNKDVNPDQLELEKIIDAMKQDIVEERKDFEQKEAKRLSNLMQLQRKLSCQTLQRRQN